jgi:cytochrome P450
VSANSHNDRPAPLFSPACIQNPYPTYREHATGAPVQRLSALPHTWGVFRHQVFATLIRDRRLSSDRTAELFRSYDPHLAEFRDFHGHLKQWLLFLDSPEHARLRRKLNAGFSPSAIQLLRPRVAEVAQDLIGEFGDATDVDLMCSFAHPLPVRVICRLLGIPMALYLRCVKLSDDFAAWFADPRRSAVTARTAAAAVLELTEVVAETIRTAESSSDNELMRVLLELEREPNAVSREALHAQCVLLLIAGHETTRGLIGNAIYLVLTQAPEVVRAFDDEALLRSTVEEVLRFESPIQTIGRTVVEDMQYEQVTVPAGESLFFMIGAANRDPGQFPDPDRFDPRRPHNRHLAFGGDDHVCLGSTLARMEAQVALRSLLWRFPKALLRSASPEWYPGFRLRALRSLHVQLEPN